MKKTIISTNSVAGFTLVEMMIALALLGIASAIAAPSWLALMNNQRLNTAQDQALRVMREAQSQAKNQRLCWEASFRDDGTKVQWSTHFPSVATNKCPTVAPASSWIWNNLVGEDAAKIAIDSSTNLSTTNQPSGAYGVKFQFDGSVNGQMGKITFKPRTSSNSKRCVFVSTLLGAMRTDKDTGCQ